MHYQRWHTHGDSTHVDKRWPQSVEERFWSKVAKGTGCWQWIGGKAGGTGYGQVFIAGKQLAHRVAYEWMVGPIPEGMVLDHLCRNRACVNPAHLEVVTHRENILRGSGASAQAARKTHCPQGHAYDAQNTAIQADGSRRCKACHRNRARGRRKRVLA